MNDQYTVAGIGEILWDVLPTGEVLGGAPLNFCYHLTALGAKGLPISTVGSDARGQKALAQLTKQKIDTRAITILNQFPTGYVTADIDTEGVARYNFPDSVAWDYLQINQYARGNAKELTGVCFGTLAQRSKNARKTINNFLNSLPKQTLRIFDINLRQNFYSEETIKDSLIHADILKLNDEELPILANLCKEKKVGSNNEILEQLMADWKLKLIMYTRGSMGSILMTPHETSNHPGIQTKTVDTIGAGDAFTAAATIGFITGLGLREINEQANRLAAYVCSRQGAMVPHQRHLK